MADTALFTDDLFLEHDTGRSHPETARRLDSIRARLERQGYFGKFAELERRFATPEEIGLNHTQDHVRTVAAACKPGGGFLDGDTVVSEQSFEAARLAAGVGLAAADAIKAGSIQRALLLVRPPGHHSLETRAMGFCLFNNIAICARYLQSIGYAKVAILDWDVHHGNGTEASFYDDPTVLFISTHQYPFYPGTGAAGDRGTGAGSGFTLNVPMAAMAADAEYRAAFEDQVLPALMDFQPDVLLISAGFDAHRDDPLAMIQLQTSSYEWMTERIRAFAEEHCGGRVISFLEGGYNLDALAESVEAHAAVLL